MRTVSLTTLLLIPFLMFSQVQQDVHPLKKARNQAYMSMICVAVGNSAGAAIIYQDPEGLLVPGAIFMTAGTAAGLIYYISAWNNVAKAAEYKRVSFNVGPTSATLRIAFN